MLSSIMITPNLLLNSSLMVVTNLTINNTMISLISISNLHSNMSHTDSLISKLNNRRPIQYRIKRNQFRRWISV